MSVQEIETAISQLPAKDLPELTAWLADYQQRLWDQQIEDDLESGRLDAMLGEVEQDYAAGLAHPL